MRSTLHAQIAPSRATSVARYFELLRKAVFDTHWTNDAIAAELNAAFADEDRHFDKSYVRRMLNEEKPLAVDVLLSFPADVKALFARLCAADFGHIVVERVDAETARQQLASGLFNLLTPQLPARTSGPIRAELRTREKTEAI